MKKIAIIYPKDSEALFNQKSIKTFGGASVQLFLMNKELNKYSNLKTFAIINDCYQLNPDENSSFNLVRTFQRKDFIFKKIYSFHEKIKEIKPDFILQRGLTLASCLLSIYCHFFKIKYIFMFAHDRESQGRYQKSNRQCLFFRFLLKFSYLLIVQNKEQREDLSDKYSFKIETIYSGYEIKTSENQFAEKNDILWVSRLDSWKRPEIFIKLAEARPQLKFVMIAPILKDNKSYGEKIYQQAAKVKNLEVLPFVSFKDIDFYFKKAKVFVNTSTQEGFPNTFIQAGKNQTPILSLKINPNNFLSEYKAGLCCQDDFAFMLKNLDLFFEDKKFYEELSSNVYQYVKKNHNIKDKGKELRNLIVKDEEID